MKCIYHTSLKANEEVHLLIAEYIRLVCNNAEGALPYVKCPFAAVFLSVNI